MSGLKPVKNIDSLRGGVENLSGRWFGRLYAMRPVESTQYGIKWYCLCECGRRKVCLSVNLRSGKTASCGCLRSEHARRWGKERLRERLRYKPDGKRIREEVENEIEASAIYDSVDEIEVINRQVVLTTSFKPDIGY